MIVNRISKGTAISIPILMNRSKGLWGPDAHEFKWVTLFRGWIDGD
jgi:hypothetical protein